MWATFIGSTFSQSPLPGVRKSGIPEGTETPAPVSTTADSASFRSSATRSDPPCLLPTANCLPSSEPRLALGQERFDALACVGRSKDLPEGFRLLLQALVQVALVRH